MSASQTRRVRAVVWALLVGLVLGWGTAPGPATVGAADTEGKSELRQILKKLDTLLDKHDELVAKLDEQHQGVLTELNYVKARAFQAR